MSVKPVALGLLGGVVALWCWYVVLQDAEQPEDARIPSLLTGVLLSLVIPSVAAAWRRPTDPVAVPATVAGCVTVVGYLRLLSSGSVATAGAIVWLACPLALVWVVVVIARDGGVGRRSASWWWLVPAVLGVMTVLASPARDRQFETSDDTVRAATWLHQLGGEDLAIFVRQANPLSLVSDPVVLRVLWAGWSVSVLAIGAAAMARAIGRGARRDVVLHVVVLAGLLTLPIATWPEPLPAAALVGVSRGHGSVVVARWYGDLVLLLPGLVAAVVGSYLVWSELVRPRLARKAGGAIELGGGEGSTDPRLLVAETLGDPSARLGFRAGDGWVDAGGHAWSPSSDPGRAVTTITRGDAPVAIVEHDVTLLAQPDLLDVAATTAGWTLDNDRLTALTLERAKEVSASGVRLLAAGDQARASVRSRIETGPDATLARVAALLVAPPVPFDEVHDGLRDAVRAVREIAHGLYPLSLVEEGLAVALDDLAARSAHEVEVRGAPSVRLPMAVEITLYRAVHAAAQSSAGTVAVHVLLDGAVTAELRGWSGPLEELLVDRIDTLAGSVTYEAGRTTIVLPLPDGGD